MKPIHLFLTAALLTTTVPRLSAQAPSEKPKGEEGKDEKKTDTPPMVETMHEITLKGQKVVYKSTAGPLTLTKAYGEPRADVFHIAYLRTDGDAAARAKRPR